MKKINWKMPLVILILAGPFLVSSSPKPENGTGKKCSVQIQAGNPWIVDNSSPRATTIYFNGDLGLKSVFPSGGSQLTVTVQVGRDPIFHTFPLDPGPMKPDGISWLGRNAENLFEMARETGWKPTKSQAKADVEKEE